MINKKSKALRMLLNREKVLIEQALCNKCGYNKLEKIKSRLVNINKQINKNK